MNQAIGTSNEPRQALLDLYRKIIDDKLSERIAAYNMKMNAALDIEACAACGIQVLGEPLQQRSLAELEIFKLSANEMESYLNLPYRTVYSRSEIRDENGEI